VGEREISGKGALPERRTVRGPVCVREVLVL